MAMAVEQKVEMPAAFDVLKEASVVSMNPGELTTRHFEVAEWFVQLQRSKRHCRAQLIAIGVAVAEDEVRRQVLEELHGCDVLDVAAVQDQLDAPLPKHVNNGLD